MEEGTTFVGLDVHKRSIAVAIREPEREVREERLPNERQAVGRWARRWKRRAHGELVCAYEAGACGYALQRQLESEGVRCLVVAPSLVPRRPGERIKTDRRDARKLAEYLKGGHLTEVRPPTPQEEAARDLCCVREDAKQDRMRCRHRLSKFLLRRGISYPAGRRPWTQAHRAWLQRLAFDDPWEQAVFDDYRLAVAQVDARMEALDRQIEVLAQAPTFRRAVGALRCFRGIDTITALGLVTELHGVERFGRPRALMAFLGLVPSEASSGERQRRGAITKAGNGHARKLMIEAAWHARHKPSIPEALRQRRRGQPPEVIAMADVAQQRLHRRYWRLVRRGKPTTWPRPRSPGSSQASSGRPCARSPRRRSGARGRAQDGSLEQARRSYAQDPIRCAKLDDALPRRSTVMRFRPADIRVTRGRSSVLAVAPLAPLPIRSPREP